MWTPTRLDERMNLGFGAPCSGSWATPGNQVEIARTAEQLGYSTLWTFSRLIYSDWPAERRLTPPYRSVHDPLTVLAYLAAVTERIRLGSAIVNLPYYAPIVLAKQLSSLDIVSGGRLDAGLGLGWSPDEFEATGVPIERRGARGEEYLACLREIWTGDPAEFAGEFYRVPRGWVDPKPVQRPHPPLYLGGTAEAALLRAGRLADGWISASRFDATELPQAVETIRRGAEDGGRDPDAVRIVIRGTLRIRDHAGPDDPAMTGPVGKVREDLARYAANGADEVFLDLNFDEQVGSPDADPARSMDHARAMLMEFADD
jgi:probable F420-dependent oxidoreductase